MLQEGKRAWVADHVRCGMLPWAAAIVAKAWRRHCLRRRLLRYTRLRLRMRHLFLRPYLQGWRMYTVVRGRGDSSRKRSAFFSWLDYSRDLTKLYQRIIAWTARTLHSMGGLHLTWVLCKPFNEPDSGAL
jgi:hypothetical protein